MVPGSSAGNLVLSGNVPPQPELDRATPPQDRSQGEGAGGVQGRGTEASTREGG